ncbi:ECF transporter S component [[Mycoplasma] falconis]|uniref:ECF transporter S component n=1 Tax=[Mycoplasma] falconis TaxID=92403 RepID=UPI0024114D96|nr:ECF transporter S component [[Mycoplasma] falconis]
MFIIFGLALGPWRAAFLGILCDTINQLIHGIGQWMIEYAIIPMVIGFISGWFIRLLNKKQKDIWISGFVLLMIVFAVFIFILVKYKNEIPMNEFSKSRKKKWPVDLALGIGITGLLMVFITSSILFIINIKTRNFKRRWSVTLLFGIIITVLTILIITRWFWGPFAFINYYNRFRNGNWPYHPNFFYIMVPIIFKSLIEIPAYSIFIFAIYPVIILIRKKINFYTNKLHTY